MIDPTDPRQDFQAFASLIRDDVPYRTVQRQHGFGRTPLSPHAIQTLLACVKIVGEVRQLVGNGAIIHGSLPRDPPINCTEVYYAEERVSLCIARRFLLSGPRAERRFAFSG